MSNLEYLLTLMQGRTSLLNVSFFYEVLQLRWLRQLVSGMYNGYDQLGRLELMPTEKRTVEAVGGYGESR